MKLEKPHHQNSQTLNGLVGVICPECGEYWEAHNHRWVQCPMCDHEFEADEEELSSFSDDDVSVLHPDSSSSVPVGFSGLAFPPLLEIAAPQLYCVNAFRVTGLPVTATEREISRHLQQIEFKQKHGLDFGSAGKILPISPAPDSDAIRDAKQRLNDPERRLVDEFFWFWPADWDQAIDGEILSALSRNDVNSAAEIFIHQEKSNQVAKVATHNLAILFHAMALDLEIRASKELLSDAETEQRDLCWLESIKRWKGLMKDEGFWVHFASRVALHENARLTQHTVRQLRETLPLALTLIVGRLALRSAERNNAFEAGLYLHLVRTCGATEETIAEAMRQVVQPLRDRLKTYCDVARQKAELNPARTDEVLEELLSQSDPLIKVLDCLLNSGVSTNTSMYGDTRDEVAILIFESVALFAKATQKWGICAQHLEKALALAASPSNLERIQEALEIVRRNAEEAQIESALEPLIEKIKTITEAQIIPHAKYRKLTNLVEQSLAEIKGRFGEGSQAFLHATNLLAISIRNVAIELHNDSEQYGHALEAITLAYQLCRDEELRKKIEDDIVTIRKNAEFETLTKDLKPISSAPLLGSVNGIGTTLYGRSNFDPQTKSYLTTLYFIILAIPIFPIARYRVISAGENAYRFLGKVPFRKADKIHCLVTISLVAYFCYSIITSVPSPAPSTTAKTTPTPSHSTAAAAQNSVEELITYLNDSSVNNRAWAAHQLGLRGRDAKAAIPALRAKLKDRDKTVRDAARAALEKIGTQTIERNQSQNSQVATDSSDRHSPSLTSPGSPSSEGSNVYPSQNRYLLDQLRREIDLGKEQLRNLENELTSLEEELKVNKTQIERYSAIIKQFERDVDLGYSVNRAEYQNTIDRHNALVREHNQNLATVRLKQSEHKRLVNEINEKVDLYNTYIRGQR